MLKGMQKVQKMIKNLEEQYDIDIIRIYHEQNQIQLTGTKGFGKLPVEDVSVTKEYTENHDYYVGVFEGTSFCYLVSKGEDNDND
jgi:hypothetical protein